MTKNNPAKGSPAGWLRVVVPALLIIAWLSLAAIGGPYFGRVSEVSSNDQTTYLPESADATLVQGLLGEFSGANAAPAIIVYESAEPLSEAARAQMAEALSGLTAIEGVAPEISPPIPSADGFAAQAFTLVDAGPEAAATVGMMRASLQASVPEGVSVYVTGPAGFISDLTGGFTGIDGLLLVVTLVAVFIILVFVYRSLLLPIAVLATSMSALTVALLVVWWLAKADILLLSGQTQGILFILVIGAATDYSLLYVARYREALRVEQDKWAATRSALRGSFEPIVASGSTVIAGLLCLLLSDLKSNSTLGPVASIGIVFAMLSALTLLPALLYAFGRTAFWPRAPRFEPGVVAAEDGLPTKGIWLTISRLIPRRPRLIWVLTTVVLAAGALGLTQLDATGVPQSDLILGTSEARDGQVALGKHFPGGSGSPVLVVTEQANLLGATNLLLDQGTVASVSVVTADSATGTAGMTREGVRVGRPGSEPAQPTVVRGDVMLQATLTSAADSESAIEAVRSLRSEFATAFPGSLIGGVTATALDTNDASIRDRNLIIPIVLVVIVLILMMLLRSVLAPILLVATTVLSFGTALGVAALVFNNLLSFPGADPAVPLYSFVFLVALGIDYNIFLMTRVREETLKHGTRKGILRGLAITGGVITSAGVVLAATFAALGVIPILFLAQIAFIVAFGVLLDTFVVRTLLVPALAYDIGPRIWWPSKLARASK